MSSSSPIMALTPKLGPCQFLSSTGSLMEQFEHLILVMLLLRTG